MATTPPWRTKPPERVRRIEIKARLKSRAFCLVYARSQSAALTPWNTPQETGAWRRPTAFPAASQGKPSSGLNSSVMLATSVQKLLDRTKRRKFSMPLPKAASMLAAFMFVNNF
jgi:hypothetical protein